MNYCSYDGTGSGAMNGSKPHDPDRAVRLAVRPPGGGVAARPRLRLRARTRSVFGDFDAMRRINPLGRIPSLVLDMARR